MVRHSLCDIALLCRMCYCCHLHTALGISIFLEFPLPVQRTVSAPCPSSSLHSATPGKLPSQLVSKCNAVVELLFITIAAPLLGTYSNIVYNRWDFKTSISRPVLGYKSYIWDWICKNRALHTRGENCIFVIIRQIWLWSITHEDLEVIAYIVSKIRDLEPSP